MDDNTPSQDLSFAVDIAKIRSTLPEKLRPAYDIMRANSRNVSVDARKFSSDPTDQARFWELWKERDRAREDVAS